MHLTDHELILDLDCELASREAKRVAAHLAECWTCRARRQELDGAIREFVRAEESAALELPPITGPRALLRARIGELADQSSRRGRSAWAAAVACAVTILTLLFFAVRPQRARVVVVSVPDSRLTPGAAVLVNRNAVCSQANTKNKIVPVALRHKVFQAYGIAETQARNYEVDYLITPALGGADDIHNLWPQSYSSTVWNAEVKDALEDRLREMVCDGQIDLAEAQRAIAADWVAAYQKYFHTSTPLR